jgi:hypothetical protein
MAQEDDELGIVGWIVALLLGVAWAIFYLWPAFDCDGTVVRGIVRAECVEGDR